MFIDKTKIYVKGGDGGDGVIAYRREKYVPMGGPAGGDGGKGGDVIFRVDEGLRTLVDFKYQKHFKATRGEKGKNKGRHGANAEHMIVSVPPGTIIIDDDTQQIIADLTYQGQEVIIAQGGRGGRGNIRFATAANSAPELAERGEKGQERWVVLELKLMADVGLVGFPSVGKSTLLSTVSSAQPKIGAYHFTTITPNLGLVTVDEARSFVMADLPGLIAGSHTGIGLGHEFLRHVERTKMIIHVVDMAGVEGRDPFQDWMQINQELMLYNETLAQRPQIIVANKMDIPEATANLESFKKQVVQCVEGEVDIVPISSVTKMGIKSLLYKIRDMLDHLPPVIPAEEVIETEHKVYSYKRAKQKQSFTIRRDNDKFIVESEAVEQILARMQMNSHDAVIRFSRMLRHMGIDEALRKRGATDGTIIRIAEFEFEFIEGSCHY